MHVFFASRIHVAFSVSMFYSRPPAQPEVVVPKAAAPPPPSLSTDMALTPAPAPLPPTLVSDGFARIGARTALSFAFAFLRQAWRTEDDSGLCEQVTNSALHHNFSEVM